MAVGNALLDMYKEVQEEIKERNSSDGADSYKKKSKPKAIEPVSEESILCPQCNEPLTFEGGCNICKNCGWSKCH